MEFGGAFSADAAQIAFSFSNPSSTFVERGGVGLLTQQLNFNYQQQITRLYEIGSQRTFYVAGRPQGQAMLARIAGPREVTLAFYYKFGNVCCAKDNVLQFRAAAMCTPLGSGTTTEADVNALTTAASLLGNYNSGTNLDLKMTGVVITSVGFTVQSENMVINEQVQCMFVSLESDTPSSVYDCGQFITENYSSVDGNTHEGGGDPLAISGDDLDGNDLFFSGSGLGGSAGG
jgi:hypothetical protein